MKSTLTALAVLLCTAATTPALAQDAIQAPAQKTIGGTQKAKVEPSLIVMNAAGAKLEGNTLTLVGAAPNAIIFADRPVRAAGHALTAHLLEEWAEGSDSFAKDPPNATVSVFDKNGTTVKDAVVTLKSPKAQNGNITFDVSVLEGELGGADGPASVFIDIIGMPFTPLSFAGAARRTAYRGAFYAGAAAAGAAAVGAAAYAYPPVAYPPPPVAYPPPPVAYPYYHPYYHPYYRPYY